MYIDSHKSYVRTITMYPNVTYLSEMSSISMITLCRLRLTRHEIVSKATQHVFLIIINRLIRQGYGVLESQKNPFDMREQTLTTNQEIFRVDYTVAIHWHRGEGVSVMGCCGHRYFTCTEQHIRHSCRWCRKKWLHRRSKSVEKQWDHYVVHLSFSP